jgi:hypothetical protein
VGVAAERGVGANGVSPRAIARFQGWPIGEPKEVEMALPKILLGDGKIVLLSGFNEANSWNAVSTVIPDSEERPNQAERNPDAVAPGYVAAGEWWPE